MYAIRKEKMNNSDGDEEENLGLNEVQDDEDNWIIVKKSVEKCKCTPTHKEVTQHLGLETMAKWILIIFWWMLR